MLAVANIETFKEEFKLTFTILYNKCFLSGIYNKNRYKYNKM